MIFSPPKCLFSGVGNCFFLLTLLSWSVFFFPGRLFPIPSVVEGLAPPPLFWASGDIPVDVLKREGQRLYPERSWLLPPHRISGVMAGPPESRRGRGRDPLLQGGMCCVVAPPPTSLRVHCSSLPPTPARRFVSARRLRRQRRRGGRNPGEVCPFRGREWQ